MLGSECASYGSNRLLLQHRAIREDIVTGNGNVNPVVGTENERVGTTAMEDIDRIGGDTGAALHQRIEREIAHKDTGGGMSRTMSGPNTDGETVATISAITQDGINRILAREAGLREMNGNVVFGVVGGVMDDCRIILGLPSALILDHLSALWGNTKRTVIDAMNIAALENTGPLTGPAKIRRDYPHLRQQTRTKHQITTQIHWRTWSDHYHKETVLRHPCALADEAPTSPVIVISTPISRRTTTQHSTSIWTTMTCPLGTDLHAVEYQGS